MFNLPVQVYLRVCVCGKGSFGSLNSVLFGSEMLLILRKLNLVAKLLYRMIKKLNKPVWMKICILSHLRHCCLKCPKLLELQLRPCSWKKPTEGFPCLSACWHHIAQVVRGSGLLFLVHLQQRFLWKEGWNPEPFLRSRKGRLSFLFVKFPLILIHDRFF